VIVGAGAIGVEFAYFYNAFGAKVTLVEMLPQILPVEDEEVAKTLHRAFEKQGIAIRTATKCENFRVSKNSVKLTLVQDGKSEEIEAETVLSAIGVVANIEGVLSPKVKLELDRNYVKVGDDYQSNVKGIYAAGDIIGPPWLAHVATYEAVNAVNGMFGHGKPKRVKNFPGCTYCQPQVASTGCDRADREGERPCLQNRQISVHRVGQGRGFSGERGFRQSDQRCEDRRDLRSSHYRLRGDRAHRRIWTRDGAGSDDRGNPPDDPRAPDPERSGDGSRRGDHG